MQTLNPIIAKLISHIEAECTVIDRESVFDDMIDECYSFESVGGPFAHMSPSRVLREVDPIAHRCGVNDYFGTDDSYIEVGNETYRKDEVDEAQDSFVEDLDNEGTSLEMEIEEMESEEDHNIQELAAKKRQLADLQSDMQAAKDYAF